MKKLDLPLLPPSVPSSGKTLISSWWVRFGTLKPPRSRFKQLLTGHLVLSTVHTNDAPGTITRLIDMGIEPFLISSAMILILAQRLIRKICMDCREPIKVHPQLLIDLGIPPDEVKSFPVYKGKGCPICNNTGYKGRLGLYEVMPMKEEVKELILSRASTSEIKKGSHPFRNEDIEAKWNYED